MTAVRDPFTPIRAVVAPQAQAFAGRPYSLWRDDPEIARALNDGLVSRGD